MNLTFIQLAPFLAAWRRLGLTDEDLSALEQLIGKRPEAGAVMSGTSGVRKIRFAPPSWHTGKSGATRVCYVCFAEVEACYLFAIFAKNDKVNLSASDKAALQRMVSFTRMQIEER